MHRRFLKSLATVMGAAALLLSPVAFAASAQAETLTEPDDRVEGTNEANQVDFWYDYLAGLTPPITGATCTKSSPGGSSYELPELPAGTEYAIVVTKAGDENALPEGEKANWVFWGPEAGDVVTAVEGKGISHIIVCTIKETTTTTTPPHSTPPVVDTDRVSTGSGANLGLYGAAAALLVGAAAIVAGRRRQGAHR